MGHHPQTSAAELGLFTLPLSSSSPPPPSNGDLPYPVAQSACDERGFPLEEQKKDEGTGALKRGLGEEGAGGEKSDGRSDDEGGQPKLCVRGHWRPSEDAKLRELVLRYGAQNWNLIAEKLQGRSGKSCRLRWFNQLDPRINKRAFSGEEEEKLLALHRIYGNKWALIASLFPGRTDNAVKNQWHVIMARKEREQCGSYRRRRGFTTSPDPLAQALPQRMEMSNGKNAWSGESTITSTRDESASTCTGSRLMPCFLKDFCLAQQQQSLQFCFGSDEKLVPRRNGYCYEKFGELGSGFNGAAPTMGVDQFGYSDAASEGSAANHSKNSLLQAETDGDRKKISIPFIDFLGVGAI